jgi:hypothetical protein
MVSTLRISDALGVGPVQGHLTSEGFMDHPEKVSPTGDPHTKLAEFLAKRF